jgi:ribonuclease R
VEYQLASTSRHRSPLAFNQLLKSYKSPKTVSKRTNRPETDERPLKEQVIRLISTKDYRPLDKVELSKALNLHSSKRRELRDALRELEFDGSVARIRKDRYVLPQAAQLVTGRIEFHRNGSAHVISEREGQADVFVASANTGVALHGDRVVVRLDVGAKPAPGAMAGQEEGRVIRIVERAATRIVGTLQRSQRFHYVVPDDPRISKDIYVESSPAARIGDKVVVRIDTWDSPQMNPEGTIVETLGPANAPGVDMLSIIKKHGLPERFPDEVLAAADRIPEAIDPSEILHREDCRGFEIVTIDPDDAKDFDDAIHVERLPASHGSAGGWRLQVHIADVSHYVLPGNALDREARSRGNSTYLADRVIPMLPERLSNGICSLKPHVDRLTFAAFIDFDHSGKVRRSRFARAIIRSAHRFSYKQAFAVLSNRDSHGVDGVFRSIADRLHTAWELASLLRRNRFAAGSLDLDFPEVKVWLDEEGRATKLERVENDISHQLIEEFMLAANEAVAAILRNRLVPTVYRIHEKPDPDRLKEFREIAGTHGIRMGNPELRSELQKALKQIRGTPEEFSVKLALLRRLKRAAYHTQPVGHYGLAKANYTHFTSPIRRYADLIVHRSLEDAIKRPASHDGGHGRRKHRAASSSELGEIAAHISKTERLSADAETESVQLKKIEFFERQLKARNPQEFRAIVTDVRSFGLIVELPEAGQSGMIHVSQLGDDFFQFDSYRQAFFSRRTKKKYGLGDELEVIVARVDRTKRQVDFVPVETAPKPPSKGRSQRRRPN